MVKKVVKPVEEHEPRGTLYEAARRVLLAGMGAVALAQEEAEDFVNRLVERGEIAEKDARVMGVGLSRQGHSGWSACVHFRCRV